MRKKISLLHATRGDFNRSVDVKNEWLDKAKNPDAIEHIFGFNKDDVMNDIFKYDKSHKHIVNKQKVGLGGDAVKNWNNCASISNGELLFCIADDFHPFTNWDSVLLDKLGVRMYGFYVISINDFDGGMHISGNLDNEMNRDRLLCRHPIMTKSLYHTRGYVFYPSYSGFCCDNDLTIESLKRGYLLDFTELTFKHEADIHKIFTKRAEPTESFNILYNEKAQLKGSKLLTKRLKDFEKKYQ